MDHSGVQPSRTPHAFVGVLCALAVLLPYYGMAIWSGISIQHEGGLEIPTPPDMLFQVLAVAGLFCGLTYVLMRFVLNEDIRTLHGSKLSLLEDLLQAVNLSMLLLLAQFLVAQLTGSSIQSPFNELLGEELNSSPFALFVWAGPVAWIQAALTEELTRAFILSRFWQFWSTRSAQFSVLVVMSLLFGCGHYYQGLPAVAGTFVIGLVFGLHYMRYRSLRAIILGHGIYDSTVMLLLLAATRYGAAAPAA